MLANTTFEEFIKRVNSINDLVELYFRVLPVIIDKCGVQKLIFFRYSNRKECFDLKVGLKKEDVDKIVKGNYFGYDYSKLVESEFNMRVKKWTASCNDVVRNFIRSYIENKVKKLDKNELNHARYKEIFDVFELPNSVLFVPLLSRDLLVGFIILSDICDVNKISGFLDVFACALDKLLLLKSVKNLESMVKTAYQNLRMNEKVYEVGKTALMITHEMKNSLVGVIGLFDKLSNFIEDDEKAIKYRNIIKMQLEKLYNFTLDINKFSKVENTGRLEKVDIRDIIDNSIEMASTISNNVSFSLSIKGIDSWVYGHKDQLEQVFLNLFKNSIEAKKNGKLKISVSIFADKNYVIIKVKDNAGGVDEKILKDIDKPFFTTKSYGTGLGLAIVRNIIESYNGQVSFRNVSSGLECTIKLPMKQMEENNGKENHGSG